MKLIKCIIQPQKLNAVVQKLQTVVAGMTVWEVRGHGRQRGQSMMYRGVEYDIGLLPKILIDIVTDDNKVEDVLKIVTETARTGNIGDGRIFVLPVEAAYHVRTGFMELD